MKRILMLLILMVAAAWQLWLLNVPPAPVAASAEPAEFSALRARQDLREITREPHPLGTPAHAEVRQYIVRRLSVLGLNPSIQTENVTRQFGNTLRIATVRNIVARLPGTASEPGNAVLLMSHYDSVPGSPGATDAGNGVAAILEALRALQAGSPLQRDVIVLISDAEEPGLLGAQAFVENHPWADDVAVALNFEGRGYTGPVSMFRTAGPSGDLIRQLAELDSRVTATSVTDAVFRIMPNDTDLSLFAERDIAGLDFANAHGLTHYHQPLDSFENASPGSLQHHGDYALGLVRQLAASARIDTAPVPVYFTLPGAGLVQFPVSLALPATLLVLVLVSLRLFLRLRRQQRPLAVGFRALLAWVIPMAAAAGVSWLALQTLLPLLTETGWYFHNAPHHSGWYLLALLGLSLGVGLWVQQRWFKHADRSAQVLTATAIWSALGIGAVFALPGTSFVFFIPALLAVSLEYVLADPEAPGWWRLLLATVISVLLLWLLLPMILLLEIMLTLNLVALCVILLWLLYVFLQPLLDRVLPTPKRQTGLAAAVAGLFALAVLLTLNQGLWTFAKPTSVGYAWLEDEAGQGETFWYSRESELDSYIRSYLGDDPDRGARPDWGLDSERWLEPAPELRTDAPSLEPTSEGWQFLYPADAYYVEVVLPEELEADTVTISGQDIPAGVNRIQWFAPPPQGLQLSGNWTQSGESVLLSSVIFGLPQGAKPAKRSPDLMHRPNITYLARQTKQ